MNQLKHFIQISDLKNTNENFDMINGLLLKAIFFAKNLKNSKKYDGEFVASIFMEPSTRTQLSFEVACKRLGIHNLNLDVNKSSFTKGESFQDTLETLQAMGAKAVIVRTKDETLLQEHRNLGIPLINAGGGALDHPSQAMLDLFTIQKSLGRVNKLKIAIIGDLEHSRVANSNIDLHLTLGNEILLYSPPVFKPLNREQDNIKQVGLEEALSEADVVMLLRVQFERHSESKIQGNDYLNMYGLTTERLKLIKDEAVILHPGPINRGVELDEEILNDSRVKILEQVKNSVPMRMAIIDSLLEGAENE